MGGEHYITFKISENKANPAQCQGVEKPGINTKYFSMPEHKGLSLLPPPTPNASDIFVHIFH